MAQNNNGWHIAYDDIAYYDFNEPSSAGIFNPQAVDTAATRGRIALRLRSLISDLATPRAEVSYPFGVEGQQRFIIGRDVLERHLVEPVEIKRWDRFTSKLEFNGWHMQFVGWTNGILIVPE